MFGIQILDQILIPTYLKQRLPEVPQLLVLSLNVDGVTDEYQPVSLSHASRFCAVSQSKLQLEFRINPLAVLQLAQSEITEILEPLTHRKAHQYANALLLHWLQ